MAEHYCPGCRQKVNWVTAMVKEKYYPYCSQACQWEHQVELAERDATPEGRSRLFESSADDEMRRQLVLEMLSRTSDELERFIGELRPIGLRILSATLVEVLSDPASALAAALALLELGQLLSLTPASFWDQFERLLTASRPDFIAALPTVLCAGERAAPTELDLLATGLLVAERQPDRAAAMWQVLLTRPGWIDYADWRAHCLESADQLFVDVATAYLEESPGYRDLVCYVVAALDRAGWSVPAPLQLAIALSTADPSRLAALGEIAAEPLLTRAVDPQLPATWFEAFLAVASGEQQSRALDTLVDAFEALRYPHKVVALDRLTRLGWQPMILGDDVSAFMQVHETYGHDFVLLLNAATTADAAILVATLRALPAAAEYLRPMLVQELAATAGTSQPWHDPALAWVAADDPRAVVSLYTECAPLRDAAAAALRQAGAAGTRAVEAAIAVAASDSLTLLRELQAVMLL